MVYLSSTSRPSFGFFDTTDVRETYLNIVEVRVTSLIFQSGLNETLRVFLPSANRSAQKEPAYLGQSRTDYRDQADFAFQQIRRAYPISIRQRIACDIREILCFLQ